MGVTTRKTLGSTQVAGFNHGNLRRFMVFKRMNHPNISFGTDKMGVGTKHLCKLYGYALKIADNKIQVPHKEVPEILGERII